MGWVQAGGVYLIYILIHSNLSGTLTSLGLGPVGSIPVLPLLTFLSRFNLQINTEYIVLIFFVPTIYSTLHSNILFLINLSYET